MSGIKIKSNKEIITIISVYIAPNQKIHQDHLNKLLVDNNLIIVGDINAKNKLWGSPVNDYRGRQVEKFLEDNSMVVLNSGKGTRLNHNGSLSHLDIVISTGNLSSKVECEVMDDLWGSDHYPLMITYDSYTLKNSETNSNYNYKKARWDLFQNHLINNPLLIDTNISVDKSYSNLVASYKDARDISIPRNKQNIKHKYSPFWTLKCSEAKKLKKQAEKTLRKEKNLGNQIHFKKLKANFKRVLAQAKQEYWNSFCSKLKHKANTKEVWETINKIKGKKPSSKFFLKDNLGKLIDDKDLAQMFALNFQNLSSDEKISPESINIRPKVIKLFLENPKRITDQNKDILADVRLINEPFKKTELSNVIKNVNLKSIPGSDEIPFLFYFHSPESTISYILNLINNSWTTNVIPNIWKTAIIKPILKPTKSSADINSYRPISITNTISKIIEKMIVKRLNWFLDKNNLLNPHQAGFRKNFSTCDPIARLNYEAEFAVSQGYHTVAVMIDFTKAFDLLWIDGLLTKIAELKIVGNTFNYIKNFLTNRSNSVKIGNYFSANFSQDNGTPQGSSLSPLLFLIMINDFPKLSQYTSDALFADDCTIWRSGKNIDQIVHHLQEDLEVISKWVTKWGLSINVEKTTAIIFTKSKINVSNFKLKVGQSTIVIKNSCKLLGVVFDKQLTWKPHIDFLVEKASKGLNIMRCVSGTNWGSNKETLITIYKSLILSQIDYCSFVYDTTALSNSKKLDTIQYKALLIATGGLKGTSLNALLGECLEIPLKYRRQSATIKYLLKIKNNISNSAHHILNDKKYFHLELVCKSKYKTILNEFTQSININLPSDHNPSPINHFNKFLSQVDLSLVETYPYFKKLNSYEKTTIINEEIEILQSKFEQLIFADASINTQGNVGIAVSILPLGQESQIQLPNNLSIYYAEAYAVLHSLTLAAQNKFPSCCVISDNTKILNDIKFFAMQDSPHPLLIQNIINHLSNSSSNIHIKWMPGHCNHPILNAIDLLAKKATTSANYHNITYSKYEASLLVDPYIRSSWIEKWKTNPIGTYQNTYPPTRLTIPIFKTRKKDIVKNRIRMLHTKLNSGLHKLGLHPSGECDVCGVEETVQHFILYCIKTEELRKVIFSLYPVSELNPSFQELTSNSSVMEKIADFVMRTNLSI